MTESSDPSKTSKPGERGEPSKPSETGERDETSGGKESSADSDIDVRGVHVTPAEGYAYLRTPTEEVTVNMDGTTEGYDPRPKKFLYVYRGLLGAQYVLEHEDIEADVRALAETVDGGDSDLVDDLIAHKREADEPFVSDALEERARAAIVEQFNALDTLPDPDKTGYRAALDDWMRKVRT